MKVVYVVLITTPAGCSLASAAAIHVSKVCVESNDGAHMSYSTMVPAVATKVTNHSNDGASRAPVCEAAD